MRLFYQKISRSPVTECDAERKSNVEGMLLPVPTVMERTMAIVVQVFVLIGNKR